MITFTWLALLSIAVINVHSVEYDAVTIALSLNSSIGNNITINVRKFDFSEDDHHFNQGTRYSTLNCL